MPKIVLQTYVRDDLFYSVRYCFMGVLFKTNKLTNTYCYLDVNYCNPSDIHNKIFAPALRLKKKIPTVSKSASGQVPFYFIF
jgi:hypothetical protein